MVIFSFASILLMVLSICSYYYRESSISDIYASAWVFYITSMGSGAVAMLSYDAFNANYNRMSIWAIAYLVSFIVITQLLKIHLLKWWRSFFNHHEQISIPNSLSNSGPLPIPQSQLQHIRFSTKLIKALKLPPRALVRMSSTYFQPASVISKEKKEKNARTMSHDLKELTKENFHFRSVSSIPRETINQKSFESVSFNGRKCSICYESECNAVLMDCGHGGICMNCAGVLFRQSGQCHMCRATISQVLKIKPGDSNMLNVIGTNMNIEH